MLGRLRSNLTYANVASTIALVAALGTGGAYAANTIGSSDIIDESIISQDIKNGEVRYDDLAGNSVTSSRLKDESVLGLDVLNGTIGTVDLADAGVTNAKLADGAVTEAKLADDAVTAPKIAASAVGQSEIATDGVAATEVQNDSIDSGEIVDFGLSNQDIGVLFAEVSATAVLDSSSGGVTVTRIGPAGAGQYEVDFGRNIVACTSVATLGGSSNTTALGEVNVADRSGNVEAVFVDTNTSAGAAADKPFRLVVVC